MRMKILLIPCCCFFMLILASASSSSSSFSLSNNDDLQVLELETEMQQLFRPEKWLHHFKDSVKDTIDCYSSLLPMVLPSKKPDWVFRMLDAAGKFGLNGGLFDGNLVAYGSFDECIQIQVDEAILQVTLPDLTTFNVTQPAFTGQYVLNTLVLNLTTTSQESSEKYDADKEPDIFDIKRINNFRHGDYGLDLTNNNSLQLDLLYATLLGGGQIGHIGLCIPSTCNAQGLQTAINRLLDQALEEREGTIIDVIDNFHYTKVARSFSAGDIVAIIVLALIIGVAVVGTAIDTLIPGHHDPKRHSMAVKLLLCFSLKTNGSKLLSTQKSEGNIDCINGIRFLSMAWVVLGHTFYGSTLVPMENVFKYGDVFGIWSIQMVSAATQSVDTFFLLSGFLMSYLTLKDFERRRFVNWSLPFYSYLHRYIRLTPAYGLIMLVLSTLMLHLGTGPLWAKMEKQSDACAQQWWKNLLYINNFFDPKPTCMGESWYLACDFQLFLLGPWIMILIWKVKRFAKFIMAALLVISCTIPGLLTGLNHWPPQNFSTILFGDWMSGFYTQFYTRSTPYIWGIIFGCIVFNQKSSAREIEKSFMQKILIAIAWLISTTVGLTTVFGLVSYWPVDFSCLGNTNCFSMTAAVLWASFGRLAWSLVVSWVIYACINGYEGGIINGFLSWSLFAPLSRLTYTIYLIHMHIIFLYHFGADNPLHFERYSMVYNFFGHLVISTFCALTASLLFEAPFIGLEKLVFARNERRPEKPKETSSGMANNGFKKDVDTEE